MGWHWDQLICLDYTILDFMVYQNSLIPSAVMPYYKMSAVCLPDSLDSDLDGCHSFNCFISVHIKQTHTSKQRHHVRTDICSQTHFMVAVYTEHVWNQAVKSSASIFVPYVFICILGSLCTCQLVSVINERNPLPYFYNKKRKHNNII